MAFRWIASGLWCALFGVCWAGSAPGRRVETMTHAGEARSYVLRVPAQATNGRRLPLVMLIHGFSGNASAIESYTGFGRLADEEGFILLIPEGLGRPTGWNTGFVNLGRQGVDDVAFLSALLDQAVRELPVDRRRVFVAGHSNGAMMANVLAARRPDRIAAAAGVAGLMAVGRTDKRWMSTPSGRVNLLHIHGTGDRVVGYDDKANALLVGASAPDAVKWFAEKIGLKSEPVTATQGSAQVLTLKDPRTTVQLWTLPGWGHDWPRTNPINATDVIWNFFKRHPKR